MRNYKAAAPWRLGVAVCAVCAAAATTFAWTGAASSATGPAWNSIGSPTFTDSTSNRSMTCTSSTATMAPSNTGSNPMGQITSLTFSSCTAAGFTLNLTAKGLSWPVTASPAARIVGETSGGHGVSIAVTSTVCNASIDGTGANTDTGTVNFSFQRLGGTMAIVLSSGNLRFYGVSGCTGFVQNGDSVSFTVRYRVPLKLALGPVGRTVLRSGS